MSRKSAQVVLDGDGLRFEATTGSGHRLVLDDRKGGTGPSPSELVPVSVAACTAMDVISILRKKRQQVTSYAVEVTGDQREDAHPAIFTRVDVVHVVEGTDIDVEAVRRAVELSATRYCAVGGTLSTGSTEIHHAYLVRSGGSEERGEVVVTGPNQDFAVPVPAAQGRAAS
jgi:putative redox protein